MDDQVKKEEQWIKPDVKDSKSEAPMSVTTTGYYKGFSMMVTRREENANVMPLIRKQMLMIDWMVEQGFNPSWNNDTNKAVQVKQQQENLAPCRSCGGEQVISQKSGKAYCKALCWKK